MSIVINIIKDKDVTVTVDGELITVNVVNVSSGGAWGGITGTLTDQADLQAALNGKISHSLATVADSFLSGYESAPGVFKFRERTLAQTLAILKLWNSGTLTDGAAISADCDDYKQFAWDLTTVETATAITLSNLGKVVDIAIYKPNAPNTVVTLAATGYIFHFFDADNDNYSLGTNCTLSGAAGTSYSLNLVVTGITPAGSIIIQCTGSYSAFS
jgi:hypothetical protein